MKKSNNYLLLSAVFLIGYLVVEFTDVYGNSTWFRYFLIIIFATFLISGISSKRKKE